MFQKTSKTAQLLILTTMAFFPFFNSGCSQNDGNRGQEIRGDIVSSLFKVDSTLSTVTATPVAGIADGSDVVTIEVHLVDNQGNDIPGLEAFLEVSGSGNVVTQPSAIFDSNGLTSGSMVSTVAETKIVTVVIIDFLLGKTLKLPPVTVDFQ